jgi:hypothetical protein
VTKRLYIETTIPSYLAAWPSRDLLQADRQQLTHDWWTKERKNFDLCISEIVLQEVADGDADAAKRRLIFLQGIPLLDLTEAVNEVAKRIMESSLLPVKATRDAVHIGVSAVHDVDILPTWNCKHIANAAIMQELGEIVASCGFEIPILCTPEELQGE